MTAGIPLEDEPSPCSSDDKYKTPYEKTKHLSNLNKRELDVFRNSVDDKIIQQGDNAKTTFEKKYVGEDLDLSVHIRITSQTSINEALPRANNERINSKAEEGVAWNELSFLGPALNITNERSPIQTCPSLHAMGTKTENDEIDFRKKIAEPSLQPNLTLRQVDDSSKHVPGSKAPSYHCKAEEVSINSIYLHIGRGEFIYRWLPGSEISFNVNDDSFRNAPYYVSGSRALACLERAAEEWNKGDIGVRFKRVANNEPAVFQLVYSDSRTQPYFAYSFFPGDSPKERRLCVHNSLFTTVQGNDGWLTNIFCHELGHILGLRHVFAHQRELHKPSVQLGKENDSSVMNYFNDLGNMRIQESDYAEVREFYKCQGKHGEFKIVNVAPEPKTWNSVVTVVQWLFMATKKLVGMLGL
ncbi:hypothetical protein K449DRAFT_468104 [Hypoxylon sp. EC38]|nr:hypothetical protein K449DRAFT_468104 [Hypoxylon sp. EC38]